MKKIGNARNFCLLMLGLLSIMSCWLSLAAYAQPRSNTPAILTMDPTSVTTDPVSISANVTESFNVTISVADVSNMFAWQVKITFDNNIIECANAFYPPDNIFASQQTSPVSPVIQNSSGYVLFGASLQGGAEGVNGGGKLCVLTFVAKNGGTSPLNFSLTGTGYSYLLDSDLNDIPTQFQNGTVNVVPEFSNVAIMITFVALSSAAAVLLRAKTRIQKNPH
jgi:hypothetical protein